MFNKCERSSYKGARGLCPTHYVGCSYQVKNGKETWASLEKQGVCKKKMTQSEKNMNQSHSHKTYNVKGKDIVKKVKPNLDF